MSKLTKQNFESNFFDACADEVAANLLGKFICRQFDDGTVLRWCITETESYDNCEEVTYEHNMFKGSGRWCPYNGMLMINCTSKQGDDNILIRSVDCVQGPCKLAEILKIKEIKNEITNQSVIDNEKLWLEDYGFTVEENLNPRKGIVKKEKSTEHLEIKNHHATLIHYPL